MAITLTDSVTYKRLVAAGNDEIWYEDIDVAAGTMVELTAATGDIDTSDQLMMFEAYQKVFVVNGANLKVIDFLNTKLTCAALTDPPAKGDILTQVTSGAVMVVDFVNKAKTAIYGYVTNGTFNTVDNVSSNDSDADMSPATFVPSAVTAGPHWYDWTTYPDTVKDGVTRDYGDLPAKAYIGCLYLGRPVLSGNPNTPFQWYMARFNHPWDFAYVSGDSLTAIAGGDGDAGEFGDIIRSMIPYKDDYMVTGCASSMWFMAGDPASGGYIRELSLTTGIFGASSWCFDPYDNFYFWGANGLYRTTIPGSPVCISRQRLPNLVKDMDADTSTHRITLAYDRFREGIVITITKLSDGTNNNWFYSPLVASEGNGAGGFFPETYPDSCGVYAMYDYQANNEDYKGLLLGCADGYIRVFDSNAKSDDIGASDQAINSYVTLGPIAMFQDAGDQQGKFSMCNIVTAGGGAGGTQPDSDDVSYKVFADTNAEKLLELMVADGTPKFGGTFTAPGRRSSNKSLHRVLGSFIGFKLSNTTLDESWSFEKLIGTVVKSGKVKR